MNERIFYLFKQSKECQREDWATHKWSTCQLEKKRRVLAKSAPRLAHGLSLNKADSHLKQAEKAGFHVNPQLKADLSRRMSGH